jgi:hypothetical protein
MVLLRCTTILVFLTIGIAGAATAQTEKTFPTDDEINLVLTQTERAMQQYKPLIDQGEIQMGKSYTEAAANDHQVVSSLEIAVKAFKSNPQAFNGPLGFAFFEWLDDADRNAVLCASGAATQAMTEMMAGNTSKANSLIDLGRSCLDVSTLLYTVSENAGSLYLKYAEAEQELAAHGAEVAEKCADVLKKNCAAPMK